MRWRDALSEARERLKWSLRKLDQDERAKVVTCGTQFLELGKPEARARPGEGGWEKCCRLKWRRKWVKQMSH